MKRNITLICILAVLFVSKLQAQILTNGTFEAWSTGPSGDLDPTGWLTSNDSSMQANVIQGTPRTGNHSCSLVSIPDGFGGFLGGTIFLSYLGQVKPLTLSGYWKGNFTATATDGITITIGVTDTSFNLSGVGTATTPASANLVNWVYFSDTVNYTTSLPAYNTSLSISLSSNSVSTNGQVDDLVMTYLVGVNEIIEAHFPSAVLRPDAQSLNHILYVDLLGPQSFQMNIFNIDGKKVYSRNFNLPGGHHEFAVPTEDLPRGMYLCSVTGNSMQQGIKFVK